MGFGLGSFFGGGSTKVNTQNKTTVNTDVDVELQNIIDLSGLEAIIQQIKDFLIADGASDAEFKSLLTQQAGEENDLTKQQQTLLLYNVAVEAERNQQLAEANKTFRIIALSGVAVGAWYLLRKKKR